MSEERKKAVVAMSGGVDSSVAALMLKEQGYDVTGVTLKLYDDPPGADESTRVGCCSLESVNDARRSADIIGIRHYVLNFKEIFMENVIKPFCATYAAGATPNPCVLCNLHVKFRFLMDRIYRMGFDYLATGHYAIITQDADSGRYSMSRGADADRDQTYFLYMLTQIQLKHLLFPLGAYQKSEVRKMAHEAELPTAAKKESRDICFAPGRDYASVVSDYAPGSSAPGPILNEQGVRIGTHNGIVQFTIGQRKGTNVASLQRMYVVDIQPETNTVVMGPDESLYAPSMDVAELSFIDDPPRCGETVLAQIRYNAAPCPAAYHQISNERCQLVFETPQRAVTPGQAAVFYRGNVVLGGGTIISAPRA